MPLYTVLLALGNPTVHHFSLDVEGAEFPILKTIPWDKVRRQMMGTIAKTTQQERKNECYLGFFQDLIGKESKKLGPMPRGPKSLNFPDGNFQRAKTFRTECVNCFATKMR